MRKTILTLAMMLMLAFVATAEPAASTTSTPSGAQTEALTSDSVEAKGKDAAQTVKDKINDALDDTLSAKSGTMNIGDQEVDLTPDDLKEMSGQWADVARDIAYASIWGLVSLVGAILLFRHLNRRRRYRVIEKAIENNYPLEKLPISEAKHNTVYVQPPVFQQPVPQAQMPQQPMPQAQMPQQPGRATMGTPLAGNAAAAPVVVTGMFNWRSMMPAIQWMGAGLFIFGFGVLYSEFFILMGLALIFVGLCKGFILYSEQKALQEASRRAQEMQPQQYPQPQGPQYQQPQEPMRQSTPVPPVFTENNEAND